MNEQTLDQKRIKAEQTVERVVKRLEGWRLMSVSSAGRRSEAFAVYMDLCKATDTVMELMDALEEEDGE